MTDVLEEARRLSQVQRDPKAQLRLRLEAAKRANDPWAILPVVVDALVYLVERA